MKRKNRFETLNKGFSKPGTQQKVERTIQIIIDNRIDITTHEPDWFRIACALANEFGEQGRAYFHLVSQFHPEYRYAAPTKNLTMHLLANMSVLALEPFPNC